MTSSKPISTPGKCGCTGIHPTLNALPVLVSPAEMGGKGKNTLREALISIACWRMDDTGFQFGSSFVLADTKDDFAALANLSKTYKGSPMTVFGHADPVGDDSFNKQLSGHRAQSIYAVLVRDGSMWEKLYQSAGSSEGWGQASVSHMLSALGYSAASDYGDAVKAFQSDSGLVPVDGIAGSHTRAKLFAAYMDYLCPSTWQKADFLGGGADSGGKGDYQGCGEFNPQRVFSHAEEQAFAAVADKTSRNTQNAINRRVVVFFFRPGMTVTPSKWPCPRATEGSAGCTRRSWSDGATRRSPQAERREYSETRDTFGCRFYDRIAYESPCEGVEPRFVELIIPLEEDLDGDPYQPDFIRLTSADGAYCSTLSSADSNVKRDGKNPLLFYHFHHVPPGLYTVEVLSKDHWRTILRGLSVSTRGAFVGKKSFESTTDGSKLGSPDELLVEEIEEPCTLDFGCC